ncbi:MAG: ABC transporter ATP-binding protein [Verrucomicrobiota bacterium]
MTKRSAVRVKESAAILQVASLGVRRDGVNILRDINWSVQHGQHWVMLGANGSGKTSLLSALTGYLMPTCGEITVLGETYGESDWRELRKKIGLVSSALRQMMADEEVALESVFSGKYAMIDYWGKVRSVDRLQAKRLLRQVECAYLAERSWGVLSQGERQRVLIARALMAQPKLLILDEPCAGLDPAAREQFLQFLQRLGKKPGAPTLVLVTHHVDEIMPVFSHVLLLRRGRVLAAGKKSQVLTTENLAETFAAPVTLTRQAGHYALQIVRKQTRVA